MDSSRPSLTGPSAPSDPHPPPPRRTWADRVSEHPRTIAAVVVVALLAVVWLAIDAAGQARLRRAVRAVAARGEPLSVEDLKRLRPVLPDEENMAIGLFEHGRAIQAWSPADPAVWSALPIQGNAKLPPIGTRLPPDQLAAARQFLAENESALEGIARATEHESGVYPIQWTTPLINVLLPHVSAHRALVKALTTAALVDAHDGRAENALRRLAQACAADAALRHDPFFISLLVRIACQSLACNAMLRSVALTPFTHSQLRQFEEMIRSLEDEPALRNAMLFERVFVLDTISWAYASGNVAGLSAGAAPPGRLLKLAPGMKGADPAIYLEVMSHVCEATALPPVKAVAEVGRIQQSVSDLPFYAVTTKLLTPSFARGITLYYRTHAVRIATRAALAAERYRLRYGQWPADLGALAPEFVSPDAIVDPFSGGPLIYRRDSDGIRIYSVGEDGVDDGGIMDRERPQGMRTAFDPGVSLPNPDRRNQPAATQPADS